MKYSQIDLIYGLQMFAQFGPTDRHSVAAGGFCISVFAIMKKGRKTLLVKPREHERWTEEWAPNWRVYEPERVVEDRKKWRFPSSYVKEGEAPDDALRRVMEDQLGIRRYRILSSKLYNFYEPSNRYPGKMHWDYCFVYKVATAHGPRVQPWLAKPAYVDLKELKREEFGSAQGDLASFLKPS